MSLDDFTALADGAIDEIDVRALAGLREFYRRTDPMPSGLTDRIKFELTLAALQMCIRDRAHPAGLLTYERPEP